MTLPLVIDREGGGEKRGAFRLFLVFVVVSVGSVGGGAGTGGGSSEIIFCRPPKKRILRHISDFRSR